VTDDNAPMIQVRRSVVVRVGIAVGVLLALGIGFAVGWVVHSPSTTPTRSANAPTTSANGHGSITHFFENTTTTGAPPATTTVSGPTLATCTAAVTGHYFPGQTPAVSFGGLSTLQGVGYGCENQEMLSQAMATAGHGTVYNSDVLIMAQDVCDDYPNSPLCVNG